MSQGRFRKGVTHGEVPGEDPDGFCWDKDPGVLLFWVPEDPAVALTPPAPVKSAWFDECWRRWMTYGREQEKEGKIGSAWFDEAY